MIVHLRCFIHMKDNIRRKLIELLLPEHAREEIVKDIFGTQCGTVFVKGIVDAESMEDFDCRLLQLETKWSRIEKATKNPMFITGSLAK